MGIVLPLGHVAFAGGVDSVKYWPTLQGNLIISGRGGTSLMNALLPEIQRANGIDIMCSQNLDGLSKIEETLLDRYETISKSGVDLKPLLLVLDGEYSEFDAKVQHFAKIARGLGVHVVCINIDAARNLSGTTLDLFSTRILLPMRKDSSCALCGCGIAGVMSQDGSQLVYYVEDNPHWDIINIEGVLV